MYSCNIESMVGILKAFAHPMYMHMYMYMPTNERGWESGLQIGSYGNVALRLGEVLRM